MGAPAPESGPRLTPEARSALEPVIEMLSRESSSPSSVTDPALAWSVHVADSLSGLEFDELASAGAICDVGSGAGFPGLVLAAMLPAARVDLVEGTGRKCEFIERAAAAGGIGNARAVHARAEDWAVGEGREAYDAVTARAVGRLSTLAELASPLLRKGGGMLAWKGRRDPDEEAELARAASELAVEVGEVRWVGPYAGSRNRHLHLIRKVGPTPAGLPRRAGMAKKRPRGSI
ncbi:MAG: 16S rRNA (guanine(527)-N(7))-methyltransferase RsmG [Solirubrobacterales bacterium]|nr:16S rRNA (guanine(527)-N(7))-methyltransferase RsmG [Solirubrobacterales bacterium]